MSSLTDECVAVVRHEGTPSGRIEKVANVDLYVAIPEGTYDKEKAILFLPDVFGLQLINNKLLVDDYARNGFQTYLPDYFEGDPVPEDTSGWSRETWFPKHGADRVRPIIDALISDLTAKGVKRFAAIGFCFGARYVFDLALENLVHVSACNHPSLLKVPEDLQAYAGKSKAPLLLNTCEVDNAFPKESQAKADEILGDGKFAQGYKQAYWPGCTHGFSVRGDMNDPKVKAGKEGAFEQSVLWFKKYL